MFGCAANQTEGTSNSDQKSVSSSSTVTQCDEAKVCFTNTCADGVSTSKRGDGTVCDSTTAGKPNSCSATDTASSSCSVTEGSSASGADSAAVRQCIGKLDWDSATYNADVAACTAASGAANPGPGASTPPPVQKPTPVVNPTPNTPPVAACGYSLSTTTVDGKPVVTGKCASDLKACSSKEECAKVCKPCT